MSASSERAVVLPEDLHARPAGALVRAVARFDSTVEVLFNDKTASGRSVLAIMGLNARAGATVLVRASGADADDAVEAAAAVLDSAS